ncbi:MAG: large-conductance mechanosensitive channel protein MscL [Sumerlaeia bacterium]
MKIVKEFKEFAMRGNVVDLAVGLVIGAAFGKIVSSLVADIIMPPLGLAIGGADFKELAIVLKAATEEVEAVTINYGQFFQTVLDFLIVAAAIFVVVKVMNSMKRKEEVVEEAKAAEPSVEEKLLTEIRDLLKAKA